LQNGVAGRYAAAFLLVLLAGKMLATSLTIGIGGSGGVFAPSLFMGAMLGTAAGDLLHLAVPHLAGPPGAYGLVGMGAVFAGAARAPITAVLIIFELTGDYAIVLPLMTAVVLAAGVSAKLSADTIYTLKLRRRGIDLLRGRPASVLEILTVADAMRPVLAALTPESSLDQVIARFAADGCEALPVVDDDGTYRGTVTAREAEEAARSNTLDATAGQLARALPALHAGQTLHSALTALLAREGSGLPVLSADGTRLAGWLNHRDVLRAYATRLRRATAQPGPVPADRTATPAEASGQDTADLGGYRVIDIELTSTQAPAGLRLAELAWPPSAHLLALRRDGCTTAATSGTILQQGDRLTILLPAGHAADADELLRGTPAAGPGPGPG
jgi:CIC family chloride channel protein